jgi:hypothetical protein
MRASCAVQGGSLGDGPVRRILNGEDVPIRYIDPNER